MRARRRRRLPGRLRARRLARGRRLPAPPAGRHVRGARHEARAHGEAGVHPPAPLLQRAARARSRGASPSRSTCCSAPASRQSFRPQEFAAYYRRVRSRLERFVADPPPTEPLPVDHCAVCDFKPALRRALGRGRPPLPRRRALPDADREARRRRDHDARGARARAGRARAGRDPRRHLGEAARAGRAAAPRARDRRERLPRSSQPQPESGFSLLPDPSPGDLFFDFEGNPFWDKDGSLEYLWGILDVERQLHAAARARPRDGAARVRDVRRPRARAARASTRSCTSTTTRPTRSPRSSG